MKARNTVEEKRNPEWAGNDLGEEVLGAECG